MEIISDKIHFTRCSAPGQYCVVLLVNTEHLCMSVVATEVEPLGSLNRTADVSVVADELPIRSPIMVVFLCAAVNPPVFAPLRSTGCCGPGEQ